MLETERRRAIARLVQERSVLSIAELVDAIGFVSEATVRRDVAALVQNGQIRRVRGGVESITSRPQQQLAGVPFTLRQGVAVAQKRAIARSASALIQDGESIIMAGGTTTFALAEFLLDRQLDILTNSVSIAAHLFASSRNRLMVPGGTMYPEQDIIHSPYEADYAEHFWAHKVFISCSALTSSGMMEADPLIVQAQRRLLRRTDRIVVLADSRKLRQRSSMVVATLDQISTLITDDGAQEAELEPFRTAGIDVMVAKVVAESARAGAEAQRNRA
jgi:DeoR family ulaG and ulaABCDEF operon transcriptional repressor